MNIGIVGLGIVGKSVEMGFGSKCQIFTNDKEISDESPYTKIQVVEKCDYIFVSVPTPYNTKTKEVDSSLIEGVMCELNEISKELNKKPVIIIKSTIAPRLIKIFEESLLSLNVVVSPEYLTERYHYHDFINQKVMILGGNEDICKDIHKLYLNYSICNRECKVGYCTAQEASLIKYMANTFLATKCIFNNQYKMFYDKFFDSSDDSKFNNLLSLLDLDERMGKFPFKYTVPGPDGDFGYGGKCLPKDIQAIISEGEMIDLDMSLLKKVHSINDDIRTKRDWEEIEGAMS